jgi:hypothetical protein
MRALLKQDRIAEAVRAAEGCTSGLVRFDQEYRDRF